MVNKDNLDRLEEIFREKFQEPPYDIPQNWNEPSDAVWENIEKEFDKSNSKRFFYWFTLVGAGILLLTGSYFITEHTKDGRANTVAQTTKDVISQDNSFHREELSTTLPDVEDNLNQPLLNSSLTESTSTHQNKKLNTTVSSQSLSTSVYNSNKVQSISAIQESSNRFKNLEFWQTPLVAQVRNNAKKLSRKANQENTLFPNNINSAESETIHTIVKTFPKKLNGKEFEAKYNTSLKNPLILNQIEREKKHSAPKKLDFGFLAGGFNPNQVISSSSTSFHYGKNEGKQFGNFARLNLSEKLSIEGGLNLSQMEFSGLAKAQTELKFKEMSEGYNEVTFQSKHNLATPLGSLPVDYVIKRNNNYFARQVAEDPVAQIKVEQELKQITMPLAIQYALFNTNTFKLKANAGFTTRYTAQQKSTAELISTELEKGATTSSEIFYNNSSADIKKVDINPQLGIEFSKRFKNSDIQMSIEPFMSIRGKRKTDIPATPGSNSYGLNLKISK